MAKSNSPKEKESKVQSAETETAPVAKGKRADKFDPDNANGNKLFDEWLGRIDVVRHPRTGKVTGKNFIPNEKRPKERKISQGEADSINFRAAKNPHRALAVMYLAPGAEAGNAIDVNEIVEFAFEKGEDNE